MKNSIVLGKAQVRVFSALGQQKMELQKQFQEIAEAELEQIELLRKQNKLPEGQYQLRQEGEEVIMFKVVEENKEKP